MELPAPVFAAIAALSHAVGAAIELDDGGECCLVFDDDVEVVAAYVPERELFSLRTVVLAAPPSPLAMREALALNYGALDGRQRLGYDAQGNAIVLWADCPPAELTADGFLEALAGLVGAAPHVRARLREAAQPAPAPWAGEGVRP